MRMRKKKHLEDRLLGVEDYLYISDSIDRNFKTAINNKEYLDLDKWFGNSNPVYLEIGCGKGRFATEYALSHPDINLLAVEKDSNVIVGACEIAKEKNIPNLRFIKMSAEYIERHIKPQSIDKLFLNFSCPFPKKKYASHRLTHENFLEIYKRILKPDAIIHQKTDNMHFFEFSLEQFSKCGFALCNVTLDLHNSEIEDNIVTEYESRFISLGQPIYYLEAYINNISNK